MKAYFFLHVDFEGPGEILPELERRGFSTKQVRLYAGDAIPKISDVDLAVLMGGPMSVLDVAECPFLADEEKFCKEMLAVNKPLLGICLGAQLIAHALGASIRKNPDKELGWFPVNWESGNSVTAFHFHGETFGIPDGGCRIAWSEGCKNQGFTIGSALALQFHLETNWTSLQQILKNCGQDLIDARGGKFVQQSDEILRESEACIDPANRELTRILDEFLERTK